MANQNQRLGISVASYGARRFGNALELLNHAHQLGAGGIQTGVRRWDATLAGKLQARLEETGMYLEGQISLPRAPRDLDGFKDQVAQAKAAGVSVIRTVALSGRRYETFKDLETFKHFKQEAWRALVRALPVLDKNKITLAIENHKDWLIPELLGVVAKLDSPHVGICLDTGNSISLLEDPMEVVEAYAPYTVTTHFKDMDLRPYADGFLLSEVPLGEGVLDLKRILELCEQHRPGVRHNLEMITRDPLKIPCLEPVYWATFHTRGGRDLGESLHLVNQQRDRPALPRVSDLSREQRVEVEESNVQRSLNFARQSLGR